MEKDRKWKVEGALLWLNVLGSLAKIIIEGFCLFVIYTRANIIFIFPVGHNAFRNKVFIITTILGIFCFWWWMHLGIPALVGSIKRILERRKLVIESKNPYLSNNSQ